MSIQVLNSSSGGSGTTINPTNGVIPVRSNATTFIDSHLSDNGTTITASEPISGTSVSVTGNIVGNSGFAATLAGFPGFTSTNSGLWFTNAALSTSNYSLLGDGTNTRLNAPSGKIQVNIGNNEIAEFVGSSLYFPGNYGASTVNYPVVIGVNAAAGGLKIDYINTNGFTFIVGGASAGLGTYGTVPFNITSGASISLIPGGGGTLDLYNTAGLLLRLNSINGLIFPTDNTWDIGAVSTVRPRSIYAATSINSPIVNATSAYQANGVAGVSAGPFTVITSITTSEGIVTALSGTSDERLKNAQPYTDGLNTILAINPVRYMWNDAGQKHTGLSGTQEFIGFIAQNIQKAIPEAITATEGNEKYLSLDDRPIIAALVNAVKELNAEIKELKKGYK